MILGLSGKALSGKDTVADYVISRFGWHHKLAFADNLKSACSKIFDISIDYFMTQEGKSFVFENPIVINLRYLEKIISWMNKTHHISINDKQIDRFFGKELTTPREVLQFVGTDVMRYYCAKYHTEVIVFAVEKSENVVITDVRFENEVDSILSLGGAVVRIERPDWLRCMSGASLDSSHSSEVALDSYSNWDYVIDNNSLSLDVLFSEVDTMMKSLFEI